MKEVSKVIKHNIVSLYTRVDYERSLIKFGSWDPTGIEKGSNLTMLKTRDTGSWALKPVKFAVHAEGYTAGGSAAPVAEQVLPDAYKVYLEPSLPYVYVPSREWTWFKEVMVSKFNEVL